MALSLVDGTASGVVLWFKVGIFLGRTGTAIYI